MIEIKQLTKKHASLQVTRLTELANYIPEVMYIPEDILADRKVDGRYLHGKWDHSFILEANEYVGGFIMGYERAAERNDNYSFATLYLSELVVDHQLRHQGNARRLMQIFLQHAIKIGSLPHLGTNELVFSLQTNAASWNQPVQEFYKKFGFRVVGCKTYDNRSDVVMRANVDDVMATGMI